MHQAFLEWFVSKLVDRGVTIEHGLTDSEIDTIQNTYGFVFPPDLRRVLQYILPVYQPHQYEGPAFKYERPLWVDWRHSSAETIHLHLSLPLRSISNAVERHGFWVEDWGLRPSYLESARSIARQHVLSAPPLVPIYSHRYIPSTPSLSGNPVYSILGTDIIRYGDDLEAYFKNEFLGCLSDTHYQTTSKPPAASSTTRRYIPFWDDLVRLNGGG